MIQIIDKIRAEVERRHKAEKQNYEGRTADGRPFEGWAESLAIMGELEQLLSFLDTMQEPDTLGFKVGDIVRLKDGDGRPHKIKSFERIEGIHGPDFYRVHFEDDSARDGIYWNGKEYYTNMVKLYDEMPEVDLEEEIEMEWDSFNKHLAEYDDESEDVVWLNLNSFEDIARHFYELGKNAK